MGAILFEQVITQRRDRLEGGSPVGVPAPKYGEPDAGELGSLHVA